MGLWVSECEHGPFDVLNNDLIESVINNDLIIENFINNDLIENGPYNVLDND